MSTSNRPARVLHYSDLALGLLSLFTAVALLGWLAWSSTRPLRSRYEQQVQLLVKEGRFEELEACLRRLIILEPEKTEHRFMLGNTYAALKRPDRAMSVMRSIAPLNEPGFLQAQYWLADQLLMNMRVRPDLADECLARLKILEKALPNAIAIKQKLGIFYFERGDAKKAMPYLQLVAADDPGNLQRLAVCCAKIGEAERAESYRQESIKAARKLAEAKPQDPRNWLVWAECQATIGDDAATVEILKRAQEKVDPKTIAPALAQAYFNWSEKSLRAKSPPTQEQVGESLHLDMLGLEADPSNERLALHVSSLLALPGTLSEMAYARLNTLARSDSPLSSAANFCLGNDAMRRQHTEEALKFWEAAHKKSPDQLILANNYAYALAHAGTPRFGEAIEVIDKALTRAQNNPVLHGTRGLILSKMGRNDDAITELRQAMSGGNGHPEVRQTLARLMNSNRSEGKGSSPTGPSARDTTHNSTPPPG